MDNQKAQLLELRDFQVGDILRFLGVPGVVVELGRKDEHLRQRGRLLRRSEDGACCPWVVNFEAEERWPSCCRGGDLVDQAQLGRGSARRHPEAVRGAVPEGSGRPWITGNEARSTEDMDPILDDPSMDRVAPPAEPERQGEPAGQLATAAAPAGGAEEEGRPRPQTTRRPRWCSGSGSPRSTPGRHRRAGGPARALEVGGGGPRPRYQDAASWSAGSARFYERHAAYAAAALHVSTEAARDYIDRRREELLAATPPLCSRSGRPSTRRPLPTWRCSRSANTHRELDEEEGCEQDRELYPHLVSYVRTTPWALDPRTFGVMLDLIRFRAEGGRLTREQVRERIGAKRVGRPDVRLVREDGELLGAVGRGQPMAAVTAGQPQGTRGRGHRDLRDHRAALQPGRRRLRAGGDERRAAHRALPRPCSATPR